MASTPKKIRQLKPPKTVRERAAEAGKPKKKKPSRIGKLKTLIAKPFKVAVSFLAKYKTFRIIGKVLSFIGIILLPRYLRNSWREIKLVTWPSRRESIRLTTAVFAFAIVFGALLALLDYGLSHLFKLIILGKNHK